MKTKRLGLAGMAAAMGLACTGGAAQAAVSQLTISNVGMGNQFGNPSSINAAQQALLNDFFNKPFSVTFAYDTDATPVGGQFAATLVSATANGNSSVFAGFSAYIRQSQASFNPTWDVMDFVLFRNAHGGPTAKTEAYFTIVDTQGGLFASAGALPPGVINTAILDQVNGEIRINNGAYSLFGGGGTASAQAAPPPGPGVPEPGAWALMIAGFGAAGAMLRRRRALPA
ncbi:MAG: PEPxxWA-CTERM sorting domain-containing protein [Phenylobacterium sp.]|uniref:PEPxxWA-CTERM sorting domain-containing protein n=1 Tax=Phenylobacterium sp. TaxID=1871053 RepID=UPI001A39BD74|nr:PEPxxWA-CTERM sorting domain-containing protein [Phenylobacterium sp.]MBL8772353.1 PEPxxWA-CTERM sorting domain-containing protein [Phenylobacterium sp.]